MIAPRGSGEMCSSSGFKEWIYLRRPADAYGALEALKKAGLRVIPVTGRPAGWCDHIARFWPIDAVVGENGAFWMWHDAKAGKLRTRFVQTESERADGRRRLDAVRADVLKEVPGCGIASTRTVTGRVCPVTVAMFTFVFGVILTFSPFHVVAVPFFHPVTK